MRGKVGGRRADLNPQALLSKIHEFMFVEKVLHPFTHIFFLRPLNASLGSSRPVDHLIISTAITPPSTGAGDYRPNAFILQYFFTPTIFWSSNNGPLRPISGWNPVAVEEGGVGATVKLESPEPISITQLGPFSD